MIFNTLVAVALTASVSAVPTNNNFHPPQDAPRDTAVEAPSEAPQPRQRCHHKVIHDAEQEPPIPGPYHLSARLASQPDGDPAYPNLCVIPATYSQEYYIGTSSHCNSEPWTLSNNTLSTTILHKDEQSTQPFSSLPIDLQALTNAGQYVTMQATSPDHASTAGDYGIWGNGHIPNDAWPNGILRTTDTPGEFSNWWLCPMPDGSEGLALKYGFHKGYGELSEDHECEMYTLKMSLVQAVQQVVVTVKPKVVGQASPEVAKELSGLSWMRNFGFANQCGAGEFSLACWAKRKATTLWEGSVTL